MNQQTPSSTLMPRVPTNKELGKFVVARGPRADGTYRVLFEVPPKLRPSGWLPTTTLPLGAPRSGDLLDANEVARIKRDAANLYQRLVDDRHDTPAPANEKSFKALIDSFLDLKRGSVKPRTFKDYGYLAKEIEALVETARPKPTPLSLTPDDIDTMLRTFDDRPTQRWQVRKVLRMVMGQAVKKRWRADNPVAEVDMKMPRSKVKPWEQDDVDAYVWAAIMVGQPWVAALILTEWEIGQRLTDCVLFTRAESSETEGYHVADGVFRFYQQKTDDGEGGGYVSIPVSDRLRAVLAACKVESSPYLFHDGGTGRPFRDVDRLSHVFEDIRAEVVKAGGRSLVLRALRHSCVIELARASCEVPEIASITGHSIATVAKMLSIYLPRDSKVAQNAQRKRGLIGDVPATT
jgi:integrase